MQNCLFEVQTWFSQNGLVIKPEKSEALNNYTERYSIVFATDRCKRGRLRRTTR
jgi:hypothetical protein